MIISKVLHFPDMTTALSITAKLKPNPSWARLPLFNRKNWSRLRFGDIVENVNERVEPSTAAEAIYVGLDDLDSGSLHIRRWGKGSDVIGTKLGFRKGDVIFGRRRAYQRKLAVAEVDGICSAHAMVARAKSKVMLPEFLPFLMMSDKFMNRAVDISVGSLSPTINWTTLKLEEFDLPPLDQQGHIAEILWAVDEVICAEFEMTRAADELLNSLRTRLGKEDVLGNGLRLIENFRPPTGWKTVTGKELVSAPITRGYTPTGSMNTETANIPFIKVYNLCFDGSFDFTKDPTFIEPAVHEGELRRSQTIPGDVLINLTGPPMGKISVVPDTYPVWNINQAIARYRIDDSLTRDYFTIYLQSHWAQTWFDMRAKKTSGQKNITLQLAQDLPVPLPPKQVMESFVASYRAVENAHRQLQLHSQANSTLMTSISNSVFV
jgi:restriction endonuclease S subunit